MVGFSNGGYLACDVALMPVYKFQRSMEVVEKEESSSNNNNYNIEKGRDETSEQVEKKEEGGDQEDNVPADNLERAIELVKEINFKAICLYMGGITDKQIELLLHFEKAKLSKLDHISSSFVENGDNKCEHKIKATKENKIADVCIITGSHDPQVFSCHKVYSPHSPPLSLSLHSPLSD